MFALCFVIRLSLVYLQVRVKDFWWRQAYNKCYSFYDERSWVGYFHSLLTEVHSGMEAHGKAKERCTEAEVVHLLGHLVPMARRTFADYVTTFKADYGDVLADRDSEWVCLYVCDL